MWLLAACMVTPVLANNGDSHGHEHNNELEQQVPQTTPLNEDNRISLTERQMTLADIKVTRITKRIMATTLYAPTEIKQNGYTSYVVSPRVDSIVLARHVSLGESVNKGQNLVTLFSDVIAQAQADYRINFDTWNRVKELDETVISANVITEAQTRYIAALASLRAYGLTEGTIKRLTSDNGSPLGEYTLVSKQEGSVLSDDFQQGQRIEAGEMLMTIADESKLWVEARLSASTKLHLPAGTQATLQVGSNQYQAEVIQEAHTIDRETRTRVVRLTVNNINHQLHPGLFGDVYFNIKTKRAVMAVPETALMRSTDGDWLVFIENSDNEFSSQEVELGEALGHLREIIGIPSGTKVVTEGAFFVASEQAKGGFDPHNH